MTSLVGAAAAAALVLLVVIAVSRNPEAANLGPQVFHVGDSERLAGQIDADGPLLFKDTLNRGRDIYVHHDGVNRDGGWLAIEAYAPGSEHIPRCILEWNGERERFDDPCSDASFTPTDERLTRYEVSVADGRVTVDLRDEAEPADE